MSTLGWKLELFSISLLPKGNLNTTLEKELESVLPEYIKGSRACFFKVVCDNNSPKWYLTSCKWPLYFKPVEEEPPPVEGAPPKYTSGAPPINSPLL